MSKTFVAGIVNIEIDDVEAKRIAIEVLKKHIDVDINTDVAIDNNCSLCEVHYRENDIVGGIKVAKRIRKASNIDMAVVAVIESLNLKK